MDGLERFEDGLHLWRLVTGRPALLGVYFAFLGVAVAGLVTALKKREYDGRRREPAGGGSGMNTEDAPSGLFQPGDRVKVVGGTFVGRPRY